MTTPLQENLTSELLLNNNLFVGCKTCNNQTHYSQFSSVEDLNNFFDTNHTIGFDSTNLIDGSVVSFSGEFMLEKFSFDNYSEAFDFYNSLDKYTDNSISYYERIHNMSIEENYLGSGKTIVYYRKWMKHFFCSECTYLCDCCNSEFLNADNRLVTFDNKSICSDCESEFYFCCDNCNDYFPTENASYIADRSVDWCSDCAHDNANWCEYCEQYEYHLCDHNYTESELEDRDDWEGVYQYNYKPRPDFYLGSADSDNQKLFFGFELEVESMGNSFVEGVNIVKESLADFVYLKSDGSLNRGFEIVTRPFSMNYYHEAIDFDFMKQLQELGFRSWNAETCGFHIHISRSGFESAGHIWKFTNLILKNQRHWEKLAGRSNSRWASFEFELNQTMKILKGEYAPQKYVAVNMCNSETIEVRIFRGSLNETRIRSAIESIYCAIEYTRNLSIHEINQGGLNFDRFVNFLVNKGFFANGFQSFFSLLQKYDFVDLLPASPESEI